MRAGLPTKEKRKRGNPIIGPIYGSPHKGEIFNDRKKYLRKTFFGTTVSIPALLGELYQIQPYGSPRANENPQMITGNDDESDYGWIAHRLHNGTSS